MKMTRAIIVALVLRAVSACANTNEIRKLPPPDPNPPTFTIGGEIRAFSVLPGRHITAPCREWFTLEQVIRDLGGFTDFSTDIIITTPNGKTQRYSISRDFRNEEAVRNMKITPGMVIHVTPRFD